MLSGVYSGVPFPVSLSFPPSQCLCGKASVSKALLVSAVVAYQNLGCLQASWVGGSEGMETSGQDGRDGRGKLPHSSVILF